MHYNAIPMKTNAANPLVIDQILAPAFDILDNYLRCVFKGDGIGDAKLVRLGVLRVLGQGISGRDYLQHLAEVHLDPVARSTFFDTFHSPRRRDMLGRLNAELVRRNRGRLPDLLAGFPELKNQPVYAVDGQHIIHGVHAAVDENGNYVSVNSLYVHCLHTGLLLNLGAIQGDGVHRHEMPGFRVYAARWLMENPARRGPRPIFVVDLAFVDANFWSWMKIKKEGGAWVITRMKENMKPVVCGAPAWDRTAEVNEGVEADELVGFGNSCVLRRVKYVDPESGTAYEFLTTVMDLAPGLIALLYLMRWRIEKVFDTAKNKLQEIKAWANGTVAQDTQAHILALTHNLLVLARDLLDQQFGIREVKVEKKRTQALSRRREVAAKTGRKVAAFQRKLPAVVQLTVQFIRTLRNGIVGKMPWLTALAHLRRSMESYL